MQCPRSVKAQVQVGKCISYKGDIAIVFLITRLGKMQGADSLCVYIYSESVVPVKIKAEALKEEETE